MKPLQVLQDSAPEDSPWYAKGLCFSCTGCGACCTGSPGYVWVSEEEIIEIAAFLEITVDDFSRRFLRWVKGKYSLIELPKTYDCVFLKDKKCQIYSVRPVQCRTFPWWPKHLASSQDWEDLKGYCEGVDPEAPVVSFEEIEKQRILQEQALKI